MVPAGGRGLLVGLELRGEVQLPLHLGDGGFDHGDVYLPTGLVFVAHTSSGTIEVIDGEALQHVATIPDCREGSGVICPTGAELVIAAARGAGEVLLIDPIKLAVKGRVSVGGRPNGLAWDSRRGRVLVADVAGNSFSIVDVGVQRIVGVAALPGRPRWTIYDAEQDHYLVNIRDPAAVAVVDPEGVAVRAIWPVSCGGPHGLDLDRVGGRAFVACDEGEMVCLSSVDGKELAKVAIAGVPDAVWFNPAASSLYVAVGEPGVLQVVDTNRIAIAETIKTEPGAQTTAFDVRRQDLYVFKPITCSVAAFRIA
jgi:DNA-binding beta-propeller fold protein YncE